MAVDDHSEYFTSFFKIILEPIGVQNLVIPIKFMNDYGSDLSDVVSLKIPTGKTWKVELVKKQGRSWLKDGWPEFVSFNSIRHGHFLAFRYGGKSVFNVYIFDMTACEIEYPLDVPEETRDIQVITSVRKPYTRSNTIVPSSSAKEKGMVALVNQYRRKFGRTLTRKEMEKVNTNVFENPSFGVIMQPSYVKFNYFLHVPSNFAAMHMRQNEGISFILQNESGDTWAVKCVGKSPLKKFCGGWRDFALDNKLRVGDVCVFELIKVVEDKRLLKVEIIRSSSPVTASPTGSKTALNTTLNVISIDD